jgi:hypothetical protein
MAVIKAVSSKAGIGHAIDYVTKKEKTEEKLVSGLHCEPETVKEEMQATKELWGKTDGRTYKHYVQSYHEDEEITPEQAHKNAVELAEHTKAWKGHEVLIATHIDKGHIHTHFIVNSVPSFIHQPDKDFPAGRCFLAIQHRKGNILHIAFYLSLLCLFQKLVGVFAPCHRFFPDFSSKCLSFLRHMQALFPALLVAPFL